MTDRPIIFSAAMVRALLDGRKTQTRRLLSIKGHRKISEFQRSSTPGYDWTFRDEKLRWHDLRDNELRRRLRAAQAGDRLWVRENFAMGFDHDDHDMRIGDEPKPFYAASYDGMRWYDPDRDELRDEPRWKPSIHMPRWASRLTLVVTGVKVERLQEISREDAIAEGCESPLIGTEAPAPAHGVYLADERTSFAQLWNRLHGPGSWDANPWIVAVSFVTHMRNIDHE